MAAMILLMYVDNNGIHHNFEDLVQELKKSVKEHGRINLQREGELDWLSVRYTYDNITGAVGCSPEAYIFAWSRTAWHAVLDQMLMLASC